MAKYVTFVVMLLISAMMYRFADFYFMEKRLRYAVWDAIDPTSSSDDEMRKEILSRVSALKVEVVPDQVVFTSEEKPGAIDQAGVVQVTIRIKTVAFPYVYRRFASVKKGTVTVRREGSTKGMVSTEGVTP